MYLDTGGTHQVILKVLTNTRKLGRKINTRGREHVSWADAAM